MGKLQLNVPLDFVLALIMIVTELRRQGFSEVARALALLSSLLRWNSQ